MVSIVIYIISLYFMIDHYSQIVQHFAINCKVPVPPFLSEQQPEEMEGEVEIPGHLWPRHTLAAISPTASHRSIDVKTIQ